ncbi:MerR family transcriptional regulator [Microbacterium pseudoresistens]|uniref:DNA-binding transcriptional MerR regulator n=1 Tax=Microbacterium pseudoresistens TaxID=640634 RepID=A0A7Y9ESX5_9MICO|nr:MerR family transcriptional regulator [Microbacterium pseudoresistens]NYD53176.1 DNA-binding transcriptional MerR regulator [Microbacterium pseudoresistens]
MTTSEQPLQTISAFSRAVGLSTSSIRDYGAIGLLVPAEVHPASGYRYYADAQQRRAIWIRRLREAGLDLDRIRTVVDAEPQDAERILDDWLAEIDARAAAASQVAEDLRAELRAAGGASPARTCRVRVVVEAVVAAIQQVMRACSREDDSFATVLLEADSGRLSITATDRRLLIRRSVPAVTLGDAGRFCARPDELLSWLDALAPGLCEFVIESSDARKPGGDIPRSMLLDADGVPIAVPSRIDPFPSPERLIDVADVPLARAALQRAGAEALLSDATTANLQLEFADGTARLISEKATLTGRSNGETLRLRVARSPYATAVQATIGDQLTCTIYAEPRHIAWTAPSQPDFVALATYLPA